MKKTILYFLLIASCFVVGCKTNEPTPAASTNTTTTGERAAVSFHLHTYIGTNDEVELYDALYHTDEGRGISLSSAQLYISNITLEKRDGSIYSIPDTIILTDINDQVYKLGNVPIGNYKSVSFDVGLPEFINSKIPTGMPLKLNDSEMWFSNTAESNNYVFMHAAGKIDTSNLNNGLDKDMASFEFKIGTQNRLTHVSMPNQNFAVQPGATAFIHMKADYAELFKGIDIQNAANLSVVSKSDNASTLAIDISSRIPFMFKYENE